MGFGLKAGRPRGEADESGAHLWRLASEKGSLLRWGHQAHSSPHCVLHCPDEVPSFSSLLAFFLGDGCSPAPHYSDPDPSVESTSAPIRSWRPLPPLEGSSGFGEYDFSSSENLRAEGLCLLPTPGVSSQLWRAVPLPHSPGLAWNSSPRLPTPSNQDFQVCDSFPFSSGRAWIQRADCGVSKHPHGCHSWISIQQLCLCSPSFRVLTIFHLGNLVSAPQSSGQNTSCSESCLPPSLSSCNSMKLLTYIHLRKTIRIGS